MFIQFISISYGAFIAACVLSLAAGSYLYAMAIAKNLKKSILSINRKAQSKTQRCDILEQLIENVQFDSRTKQLSLPAWDIETLKTMSICYLPHVKIFVFTFGIFLHLSVQTHVDSLSSYESHRCSYRCIH